MLTGSAKEKANTRDVLKASRRAKEERKAHHVLEVSFSSVRTYDLRVDNLGCWC
jgi:RNA polymerase-associated protein RTF1